MKYLVLIMVTINIFSFNSFAQKKLEQGYPFIKNYTPKEYRADTQNWAIVQDSRGVMYFGNNTGLLQFDGVEWRVYPMLNNKTVRTLAVDNNGKIFAGGIGDLGYYLPDSLGKLTYHSLLKYVPEDYKDFSDVWQVLINGNKAYFNVDKYIFIWDIKKEEFKIIQGNDNFHLLFIVNGTLYAREWGKGLLVLDGDSLYLTKGGEQFASERIYVMLPFPGEAGTTLIVTRTQGMFKFDGKSFTPFQTEVDDYIKENLIYLPGLILNDGNILLGTLNDGAVIIDRNGKEIQRLNRKVGLSSPVVYYQFQDNSGAIWLATDNGITRIEYKSQASYFDSRNNFSTTANQIIRHNGIIYAASNNGVYYLDPQSADFRQINNANNQSVTFLEFEDELLVGTLDGLFKVENLRLIPVRKSIGSEYDVNVIKRSKSDSNRIFIGAVGVWSLYKDKSGWIDEGQVLEFEDIANSIEQEKDGTLWVSTNVSGVFKVSWDKNKQGKTFLNNPLIENYYDETELPERGVLIKEINGKVYFLSEENIYKYDKKKNKFYADKVFNNIFGVVSSLPNYVNNHNIVEDGSGKLWISMGREPAVGTPQPDGSYTWLKAPFKRLSNEIIVNIYPENNRVVWFSTSSSIIKYDLTKTVHNNYKYPVLVRKVEIPRDSIIYFGNESAENEIPKIDFQKNSIKFSFAATSFEDIAANTYKTFLDGYDEKWSPWEKESRKEYTNLEPGSYTFNVIAKNVFDIESSKASYSFEILPPWYRTWTAYFLYAILLAAGTFLVDRFQRKRLLAKEKEKMRIQEAEHRAELAEIETKAIQKENERKTKELEEARELQLSMLPKELPKLPNLDIAVYMNTATEVGGDYYDFHVAEDGTLTAVIGDATGHGMKAGTMVTITKSLFDTFATNDDIIETFNRTSKVIKGLKFRQISMCLLMLKLKGNKLKISSAAMPPALIYRKKNKTVEELFMKGMPLGAMNNFPYKLHETKLEQGDTILLLSDGLPELINESNVMYGYDRTKAEFQSVGEKEPEEIVSHLKNSASNWTNGKAPDDDITFVVLKRK